MSRQTFIGILGGNLVEAQLRRGHDQALQHENYPSTAMYQASMGCVLNDYRPCLECRLDRCRGINRRLKRL